MAIVITRDQILDGMVTALAALKPVVGDPITTAKPLRSVGRYTGRFSLDEANQDGSGGRAPAIQVGFDGERRYRTSTGRRFDRVEGTFTVYCITEKRSTRDDRAAILAIVDQVRDVLTARAFSLSVRPLAFVSLAIESDTDAGLVYALKLSSIYRVDYTVDPGNDVMETATGEIVEPAEDGDRVFQEIEVVLEESA